MFFINSELLGVGLAMDAFSVSLANGLQDAWMRLRRMCLIAGTFAVFQTAMPLIGWVVVHTAVQYLHVIEPFIPWVALALLLYIGGGMVWGALKGEDDDDGDDAKPLSFMVLMTEGVATSIDALSVGFTISDYGWLDALVCSLIIGVVTFVICFIGLRIGRKLGNPSTFGEGFSLLGVKLGPQIAGKAELFGGIILILIGIEIWVTGVLM